MVTPCRSSTFRNNVVDLIVDFELDLIIRRWVWVGANAQELFWDCAKGERPLDVFVFEGTVIEAPNGTGRMDMFADRPMKDWVTDLAKQAGIVVAIGDCACWGGIPAMEPTRRPQRACRFHKRNKAASWARTEVQGRPAGDQHPGCLAAPRLDRRSSLRWPPAALGISHSTNCSARTTFFRPSPRPFAPATCSSTVQAVHRSFGEGTRTGCLFYEFGCRGPMTGRRAIGSCGTGSHRKTRAGHPCIKLHRAGVPALRPMPGDFVWDPEGRRG